MQIALLTTVRVLRDDPTGNFSCSNRLDDVTALSARLRTTSYDESAYLLLPPDRLSLFLRESVKKGQVTFKGCATRVQVIEQYWPACPQSCYYEDTSIGKQRY